jgi:hypothetical protein
VHRHSRNAYSFATFRGHARHKTPCAPCAPTLRMWRAWRAWGKVARMHRGRVNRSAWICTREGTENDPERALLKPAFCGSKATPRPMQRRSFQSVQKCGRQPAPDATGHAEEAGQSETTRDLVRRGQRAPWLAGTVPAFALPSACGAGLKTAAAIRILPRPTRRTWGNMWGHARKKSPCNPCETGT